MVPRPYCPRDRAAALAPLDRAAVGEGTVPMAVLPEPLRAVPVPGVPILDKRCPDRIEVNADDRVVTAAQIKAWVAHLRSHGWTDNPDDRNQTPHGDC